VPGLRVDVAVVGGGLGGCAAALAAASLGCSVALTEETPWEGGQLTSEAVPPDEHPWIETCGCTRRYRALREGVRAAYRRRPLRPEALADPLLNPGGGSVSRLCHEPRVALAVLRDMLAPQERAGRLHVLRRHRPVAADTGGDRVRAVLLEDLGGTGPRPFELEAAFFLDATPLGDLLPLCGAEYVAGAEAAAETGEPHAAREADPQNQQAFTVCLALELRPGEDHTLPRPEGYAFWRDLRPAGWPGPLLSFTYPNPRTLEPVTLPVFARPPAPCLWRYRRILDASLYLPEAGAHDVTLVNWPQNDCFLGPLCEVPAEEAARHLEAGRALSLSLLHWLQTEAPREDGGTGHPELRLRPDLLGDGPQGLALAPYVRESRRIRALRTVREQDVASDVLPAGPEPVPDSVGVGAYRIDLHPSSGGDPYLDIGAWPFQIPLGALVPVRLRNLLPAAKNLGVTHVTTGCYRLHPTEWNVGEAAGALAAFCLLRRSEPAAVWAREDRRSEFQALLRREGVELEWRVPLRPL
jgi:hypothetical protein